MTLLLSSNRFFVVIFTLVAVLMYNQGYSALESTTHLPLDQGNEYNQYTPNKQNADPRYDDPLFHSYKEATQLGFQTASSGDQAAAMGYFKLARQLDPESSEGAMNLGVCLMRTNLLDEVRQKERSEEKNGHLMLVFYDLPHGCKSPPSSLIPPLSLLLTPHTLQAYQEFREAETLQKHRDDEALALNLKAIREHLEYREKERRKMRGRKI